MLHCRSSERGGADSLSCKAVVVCPYNAGISWNMLTVLTPSTKLCEILASRINGGLHPTKKRASSGLRHLVLIFLTLGGQRRTFQCIRGCSSYGLRREDAPPTCIMGRFFVGWTWSYDTYICLDCIRFFLQKIRMSKTANACSRQTY